MQLLLSQYDKNNDNEISFQEFNNLFMYINEQYNDFLDIDLDFSGFIDGQELASALINRGYLSLSTQFFDDLVKEIKKFTKTNGISFDVFIRIIARMNQLNDKFKKSSDYNVLHLEDYLKKKFFLKF